MSTFATTANPTPFGVFDLESDFITEADKMIVFVKRRLGDDILSVELTKKQIWANFEEACFEYGSILNQYQAKSQLVNWLGYATGTLSGSEQLYPRESLEFLTRFAEPYASEADVGGAYNQISGSIALEAGRQDYDIYTELVDANNTAIVSSSLNTMGGKMRISEVFHFSPQAAYRFFDTTSAINYLNNAFSFESFTPETIFYVLPVFEDILRAGQLDLSNRVRRSNYSYKIIGTKIRIYPMPTQITSPMPRLFIRVKFMQDPLNPAFSDRSIYGVSNLSNIPFGNLQFNRINSIGRQWIRQYTLALSMETLGYIRSKMGTLPVPGGNVTLNGADLVSKGREDRKEFITKLKEMLDTMTYDKLIEQQATRSENLSKQLKFIPPPNGKAIFTG
jgi:hypothetical protein